MSGFPQTFVPVNHVEPVPRRIRATLGDATVLDTTDALYVWETAAYPQYYVPVADIDPAALVDEQHPEKLARGPAMRHGLKVGDEERPGAVHVYSEEALAGLSGTARIQWDALDAWFEEDEEVFVHPRSPYARVDALRSTRPVRVELDGVLLAESPAPVMLFETGLPTRYYLDRSAVRFEHLTPTSRASSCPYKGHTSGYWAMRSGRLEGVDVAWSYEFPTAGLQAIAGLVAFFNERVQISVDGIVVDCPKTHYSL